MIRAFVAVLFIINLSCHRQQEETILAERDNNLADTTIVPRFDYPLGTEMKIQCDYIHLSYPEAEAISITSINGKALDFPILMFVKNSNILPKLTGMILQGYEEGMLTDLVFQGKQVGYTYFVITKTSQNQKNRPSIKMK